MLIRTIKMILSNRKLNSHKSIKQKCYLALKPNFKERQH